MSNELSCFKVYDIRGLVPDELSPDIARRRPMRCVRTVLTSAVHGTAMYGPSCSARQLPRRLFDRVPDKTGIVDDARSRMQRGLCLLRFGHDTLASGCSVHEAPLSALVNERIAAFRAAERSISGFSQSTVIRHFATLSPMVDCTDGVSLDFGA